MNGSETQQPRVVKVIPATINIAEEVKSAHRQLRVAAYCRVSTKQEEQLNSYEVQRNYYTNKINAEPKWTLVNIYADRGITGTSTKKRDEFKQMLKAVSSDGDFDENKMTELMLEKQALQQISHRIHADVFAVRFVVRTAHDFPQFLLTYGFRFQYLFDVRDQRKCSIGGFCFHDVHPFENFTVRRFDFDDLVADVNLLIPVVDGIPLDPQHLTPTQTIVLCFPPYSFIKFTF